MIGTVLLLAALAGQDAATLFRAAREAERRGDLAGAVARYDELLARDGSLAEAWANKGLALYELDRRREARPAFERAVALKPELFIPQLFLGLEYVRAGEPRKALRPLEAALRLEPDNPKARYPLAITYLKLSQTTGRKLVAAGSPYGKLLMAEYLAASGYEKAAEENRKEAAGEGPGSAADRALYEESVRHRRRAQELLVEGVRRNPDSLEAHLLLADLARLSADERTARTEYENAAALAPENATVQLLLIEFITSRDEPAALGFARAAVRKLPAHPGLNVALGRLYLKTGAAPEAAACFRRALKGEPGLPAAWAGLAEALAATGDLAGAIAEMERAAPQDPDGSWHYRLGGWYKARGQTEKARAAFAETARIKAAVRARQEESFRKLTR